MHSVIFLILGLLLIELTYAEPPKDFSEAKKIARYLFRDHPVTLYCGCAYDESGTINWQSCGYQPKKHLQRARRIEWEHIVPAHRFGKHLACWKGVCDAQGQNCCRGRACCQKYDEHFRRMESELNNLYPAIGEINALRTNYEFENLDQAPILAFGRCLIKVDHRARKMEPPSTVKGLIARAYLYMSQQYQMPLSQTEQAQYERWDKEHPPEAWEKTWNERVMIVQGDEGASKKRN